MAIDNSGTLAEAGRHSAVGALAVIIPALLGRRRSVDPVIAHVATDLFGPVVDNKEVGYRRSVSLEQRGFSAVPSGPKPSPERSRSIDRSAPKTGFCPAHLDPDRAHKCGMTTASESDTPAAADIRAREAADKRISLSNKECCDEGGWRPKQPAGEGTERRLAPLSRRLARCRITARSFYQHLIDLACAPPRQGRKPSTTSFQKQSRPPHRGRA